MYETIIIGAGQAGLAMGYYLKKHNQSFLILEKNNKVGEIWDNRYDSLVLFTPRLYSSLPGLKLHGNAHEYPTKNEISSYLRNYVKTFELPIHYNTEVTAVRKEKDIFYLTSDRKEYRAKNLIVATGPFQEPFIPYISKLIPNNIYQTHSSQYKNPSQLNDGSVLVVGGGNSGVQIALETSKERETYLSVGHKMKFIPQNIGNKSIFWYLDKLGIYKADVNSMIGRFLRKQHDPIFGFELRDLLKNGKIIQKPRTTSIKNDSFVFEDESQLKVDNIIWATGFKSDYSWIDITDLFNEKGLPIHKRGITAIEGLYFLGLAWQSSRGSALLQGVGEDANYISKHIII